MHDFVNKYILLIKKKKQLEKLQKRYTPKSE
jgi:hypothetical protein